MKSEQLQHKVLNFYQDPSLAAKFQAHSDTLAIVRKMLYNNYAILGSSFGLRKVLDLDPAKCSAGFPEKHAEDLNKHPDLRL